MELRELAERIVFGTTLAEKLECPEEITDTRPGPPLNAPVAPGRPPELAFRGHDAPKADFPGLHRLDRQSERGQLLHFFGNHELLATELMALALLRFPDAPPAFRRGVLSTLRDEQEHTRLYMRRMADCGIGFGELPVSGFFWRCAAPMVSPLDYVTTLCLTFEQANLDFARHFAAGFETVGDLETARLLDRIYHDEIGHVAYGLKWFRRWKNPDESDWEAFCRTLRFPLTPRRAKGFVLNVDGRRAAGFDEAFIAELDVFAQSKGRTPHVYWFNPFTEGYLARGAAFAPVQHQARLARDLATLPVFLARQDDVVLVPQRPAVGFLRTLRDAGFALPECIEGGVGGLAGRKLGVLRPWAWGPDSAALLAPLFPQVTGEQRAADERFNKGHAQLYSKAWSAAFLRRSLAGWARDHGLEAWLCTDDEVGIAVDTVPRALEAIAAIRERGHHRVVAKQALGLAGQSALRLWEPGLLDSQRRWLAHVLAGGGELVIEPWLERSLDFSVQFEQTPGGLKLCGYTGLVTDRRGQFRANWAEARHRHSLPARIATLLGGRPDMLRRLGDLYDDVRAALEAELRRLNFVGPVGIDAFVYQAPDGRFRIKPIVEINPRYTMGRVTLELMQRTCPGSCGLFRLVSLAEARAAGCDDFAAYARRRRGEFPLQLEGHPVPRIREGSLCLNDPEEAQVTLAIFSVRRKPEPVLPEGASAW